MKKPFIKPNIKSWVLMETGGKLLTAFGGIGLLFTLDLALGAAPSPFPEKITAEGKELILNGTGARKATLFAIKVYDAAFYNPTKVKTEEGVTASGFPKRLVFRYVRDFDLEKTKEAWNYQFKESSGLPAESYAEGLKKLVSYQKPIKDGTTHRFDIQKDKVVFLIDDVSQGEILGENFQKALLNIFFSKNPPTKDLKKGLLGEKGNS